MDGASFPFDGALLAQKVLPRLIDIVGAFFLGKGLQGIHGLPHFRGLHPRGEPVGIQVLALFEELEPALLLGRDLFVGELVQFQEVDPAVVEQTLAALIAQAITMSVIGVARQEVFAQDPDGVGGFELAVVLAASGSIGCGSPQTPGGP